MPPFFQSYAAAPSSPTWSECQVSFTHPTMTFLYLSRFKHRRHFSPARSFPMHPSFSPSHSGYLGPHLLSSPKRAPVSSTQYFSVPFIVQPVAVTPCFADWRRCSRGRKHAFSSACSCARVPGQARSSADNRAVQVEAGSWCATKVPFVQLRDDG